MLDFDTGSLGCTFFIFKKISEEKKCYTEVQRDACFSYFLTLIKKIIYSWVAFALVFQTKSKITYFGTLHGFSMLHKGLPQVCKKTT